ALWPNEVTPSRASSAGAGGGRAGSECAGVVHPAKSLSRPAPRAIPSLTTLLRRHDAVIGTTRPPVSGERSLRKAYALAPVSQQRSVDSISASNRRGSRHARFDDRCQAPARVRIERADLLRADDEREAVDAARFGAAEQVEEVLAREH